MICFPEANIEVKGKQTHRFPWDQSLSVLLSNSKIEKKKKKAKKCDLITRESKVQFVDCPRELVSLAYPREFVSFVVTRSPPIGKRI